MYTIINTCPELTEAQKNELMSAAARAIFITLEQYIRETKQ